MPQELSRADKDTITKIVVKKIAEKLAVQVAGSVIVDMCGGCGAASAGIAALQVAKVRRNILIRSKNN